jgi:hypothetical protein
VIALSPKLEAAIGAWGRPPDLPSKVALGFAGVLGLAALLGRGRSLLGVGEHVVPKKVFLWFAAMSAGLLSILYIAIYLRGGPRIVDATTYYLQGRALAHGSFAWPVDEPTASFRGRFLVFREADGVMGGIFPPGYPALLALGFGLGAPMVVGPALAALTVIATYRLAHTLADEAPPLRDLREPVARAAALLSIVCATLRYHTADTMSHGAAALGVAVALDLVLRARRSEGAGTALGAGGAIGAVLATRPFSALGVAIVAAALLGRSHRRLLARVAIGALPGAALLALAQRAVTGAWLASSQRMYYANSDAPPGCFRWGFGDGVGCLFEHGEFVRARLPRGYGLLAAAGVTLRRLHLHLRDVLNVEPLALLVLAPLARLRGARTTGVVAALGLVLLHVLAYAPFYFDGSYPGGGARFFADLLPVEHALVAVAIARLAGAREARFTRVAALVGSFALAGFAVHGSFDHLKLRDRDGGRPMFEPDELARKNVTTGLVFVDTDHGFALGHDPTARAKDAVVVARLRDDDRDRLVYERLDRPPTFLYRFAPNAAPTLVPWAPPPSPDSFRFEAEAEWPPLAQAGGLAAPGGGPACASNGRGLVVTPIGGEIATAAIAVPVPSNGRWSVTPRILHAARTPDVPVPRIERPISGTLTVGAVSWAWIDVEGGGCTELPSKEVDLSGPAGRAVIEARFGPATLDRLVLRPAK